MGADFFLRHLLDGDAAVNTLSWRWVAGIQTQGKTYLADPSNIAKFTDGRFVGVLDLAAEALPVSAPTAPERQAIPEIPSYSGAPADRVGLLLHSDDIGAPFLDRLGISPVTIAYFDASAQQSPWQMAPKVGNFRSPLVRDQWPEAVILETDASLAPWATEHQLDQIVTPHAPVGPMRSALRRARKAGNIPISEVRREIDTAAWPLATAGFFKFRKHIPDLLDKFAM